MPLRFLHAADIHLGYRQYDRQERSDDFYNTFRALVDQAIERKVDLLLVAGDLFQHPVVDPLTLARTVRQLERLRDAQIGVFAIEGNHDKAPRNSKMSWLRYLHTQGLLKLLAAHYQGGQLQIEPVGDMGGAYYDLPEGVRIVGIQHYGASTRHVIHELAETLPQLPGDRPAYTILMLHAGLQGILDGPTALLKRTDLEPLRDLVDYVALGHIHKPFEQDDWIYNPGSPETVSAIETQWPERGLLYVEIDPASEPRHHVKRMSVSRRPFLRISFPVDSYDTPKALYPAFEHAIQQKASTGKPCQAPLVDVQLVGVLAFDHIDLDIGHLEQMVKTTFKPLYARVRNDSVANAFEVRAEEGWSREDLEQHVLQELVERDVRYREQSADWAAMLGRIKQMALTQSTPESIVSELSRFEPAEETESPC